MNGCPEGQWARESEDKTAISLLGEVRSDDRQTSCPKSKTLFIRAKIYQHW